MKKDKYDIKSSLQSWLIALICCIVVIGATVCGIVFGTVPMQVAKAEVSSWDTSGSTLYTAHEEAMVLSGSDQYAISNITMAGTITYSYHNNVTVSNYTLVKRGEVADGSAGRYHFMLFCGGNNNNSIYVAFYWYQQYNGSSAIWSYVGAFYHNNTHNADYLCDYAQFNVTSLTSTTTGNSLNFRRFFDEIVDDTPDVLLDNIKSIHFNYSGLQFSDQTANRTFTLYGYKVANAGSYTNQNGNCFVSVKYITYGPDPLVITVNQVMLNRLEDGFYLILTCPGSIEKVQVAFKDYTDWFTIEYDVYDYVGLFISNYESIRTIDTEGRNRGYSMGYSDGYAAGTTTENNLMSVMWSTFELPFRLLFGYYDDDLSSLTYGQYVGGLFNFTILGLDVRAFVLGIMSLIILVGISRFILGAFHIGG